jgi:hypothetical protein
MSDRLKGARVLVLGGSSGIGLATAAAAAADGAFVTIASRSQSKLDAALAGNARAIVLDTGDEAAVERFFTDEAPWDHVVVSAAQTRTGPVRTLGLSDAKAAMESLSRCAGGQDQERRIAHIRVWFPERAALCEFGTSGRDQCCARSACSRPRAGTCAGACQRRVARPHRHAALGRHGR